MRVEHGLKTPAPEVESLRQGEAVLLLRKGGMSEEGFRLESRRFLLLPTRKERKRGRYTDHEELLTGESPGVLEVEVAGEVAAMWRLDVSPESYPDLLLDETIYHSEGLEKVLGYEPERPLAVLLVQALELEEPVELETGSTGCRSWVELSGQLEVGGERAMRESEFANRFAELGRRVGEWTVPRGR